MIDFIIAIDKIIFCLGERFGIQLAYDFVRYSENERIPRRSRDAFRFDVSYC